MILLRLLGLSSCSVEGDERIVCNYFALVILVKRRQFQIVLLSIGVAVNLFKQFLFAKNNNNFRLLPK